MYYADYLFWWLESKALKVAMEECACALVVRGVRLGLRCYVAEAQTGSGSGSGTVPWQWLVPEVRRSGFHLRLGTRRERGGEPAQETDI